MKKISILLFFLLLNFVFCQAQNVKLAKHKFEVSALYGIQRPYYVASNLYFRTLFVPQHYRFRSLIGAGLNYYIFNRLYVGYQLGFSQEGAGYVNQYTHTNYLKNSFILGYSSKQSNSLIFDFYSGLSFNYLLSAFFYQNNTKENVKSLFAKNLNSIPIGIGMKKQISPNVFIKLNTYFEFGRTNINSNNNFNQKQVLLPAIKISVSKFIN